jgi:peptidyl-prolyl cis-trans isomerase B (cyclophilin B)
MTRQFICGAVIAFAITAFAAADSVRVSLETTKGVVVLELDAAKAPETVENFVAYVNAGHYDGTLFHRVMPGFVVQGGGYEKGLKERPTRPPVPNEANNGLSNVRGTIAMARTSDPHSATAQFFINLQDNTRLDHRSETPQGWGYCVFGRVVEGMDVMDSIAEVPTAPKGGHGNVPVEDVVLTRAKVVPLA